jgi:hypothetical protein
MEQLAGQGRKDAAMSYKDLAEAKGETVTPSAGMLPCMVCRMPTAPGTLRDYGARCFPCFQAYCRAVPKAQPRSRAAQAMHASPRREHGAETLQLPGDHRRVPLPGEVPPAVELPPVDAYGQELGA